MSSDDECVKVVVRCRPPSKKEVSDGRRIAVTMNTETGFVELCKEAGGRSKGFTFDAVYDADSTQRMVYDETAFPLVESVLEGFNGTIFAYGQTGCGKTWTMTGAEDPPGAEVPEGASLRGIIPNSFEHIFNNIKLKHASAEEAEEANGEAGGKCEFLVRASFLEIYNEEIRDLMSRDPKKKLELKESPDKGVYVKDLAYEVVESKEQIEDVLARGTSNRTVGETQMNSESSRSHSIFGIVIEMNEVDATGENHIRVGKLNFVDLAGSERQSKTGASGSRLKEGCKINLSLSALGNVISALVDGKGKHIPYRDSKLTRLLQDSLGGNTKTVMISAVSPADYNYEETLSTLRYANRAKNIKNKPVINEDPKDTLLREYKDQIEMLKQQLLANSMSAADDVAGAVAAGGAGARASGGAERNTATPTLATATASGTEAAATVTTTTEVVEVEVERVVPDKNVVAENRALQDYSDAVVEQRNRLGEELDRKEMEIERQRKERLLLEEKLRTLQGHVLGNDHDHDKDGDGGQRGPPGAGQGTGPGAAVRGAAGSRGELGDKDAKRREKVLEARKQREIRKAHLKLKEQKRKEAELRLAKQRAEEEKRIIEEECKNAQGVAENKRKALRALKKTMQAKMGLVRADMRELEQEFQEERESLLETIREQTREIKRLEQVADIFLPATEQSKLWEQSAWDDDAGLWRLPRLRPRQGYKPLHLPGLPGQSRSSGGSSSGGGGSSSSGDPPPERDGGAEVAPSPTKRRKDKRQRRKSEDVEAARPDCAENNNSEGSEADASSAGAGADGKIPAPVPQQPTRRRKNSNKERRKSEKAAAAAAKAATSAAKATATAKAAAAAATDEGRAAEPGAQEQQAEQSFPPTQTVQWSFGDLPVEADDADGPVKLEEAGEDALAEVVIPAFGDRCKSRQGRRSVRTLAPLS